MLAFEPPHFGEGATLGGAVASGLVRSAAPLRGRGDGISMLGVRIPRWPPARTCAFGGRVMKNVAGFDVIPADGGRARHAGCHHRGVAQMPAVAEVGGHAGLRVFGRRGHPHGQRVGSASRCRCRPRVFIGGRMRVRLSGAHPAVAAAAMTKLGGERVPMMPTHYWAEPARPYGICSLPPARAADVQGALALVSHGRRHRTPTWAASNCWSGAAACAGLLAGDRTDVASAFALWAVRQWRACDAVSRHRPRAQARIPSARLPRWQALASSG